VTVETCTCIMGIGITKEKKVGGTRKGARLGKRVGSRPQGPQNLQKATYGQLEGKPTLAPPQRLLALSPRALFL